MNKHCKGCKHHLNAKSKDLPKYNDWCHLFWKKPEEAIAWCKLNDAKASDQSK